jgi:hypothetical protein
VLVPSLPEVVTEGDTEQEALTNAEEAIRASWNISALMACRFLPTRRPKFAA